VLGVRSGRRRPERRGCPVTNALVRAFQLRRDRLRRNRPCLLVRSIIWTPTVARSLIRDVRNVTASSVTRSYFHGSYPIPIVRQRSRQNAIRKFLARVEMEAQARDNS
jgi:hypothetical protein